MQAYGHDVTNLVESIAVQTTAQIDRRRGRGKPGMEMVPRKGQDHRSCVTRYYPISLI
jgi:hypothetical protein